MVVLLPLNKIPAPPFAEITLRAPLAVPPMRLPAASTRTPLPSLPRSEIPFASVPMKLPWTVLFAALLPAEIKTPDPSLPEMTLRAPLAVPPIVVSVALTMRTPLRALPKGELPLKLVPIRLPCTLLNV